MSAAGGVNKLEFEDRFASTLIRHWQDVSPREARLWLWDYIGADFGDPDYDWSAQAAEDLARSFMLDVGEQP